MSDFDFPVLDESPNLELPKHRVLVVDDDLDLLNNLKFYLSEYTVDSFSDPEEALKSFQEHDYSLVLCDYQMPKVNGIEFLKSCYIDKPNTRRVLMSSFVDLIESEALWNQARVHRVLSKPFKKEELLEVVETCILEYVIEEENERLRKLALTDSVTGVANQRYFWDRLRSELSRAQRFNRPLSVLLFDVDSFKGINDDKGHLEGDAVLRLIAQKLKEATRQMDVVSRYGGDEFAIILPEIEGDIALQIASRLRDKVQNDCSVSLSGGLACFPESKTEKELLARADEALLKVKKSTKGRVSL